MTVALTPEELAYESTVALMAKLAGLESNPAWCAHDVAEAVAALWSDGEGNHLLADRLSGAANALSAIACCLYSAADRKRG